MGHDKINPSSSSYNRGFNHNTNVRDDYLHTLNYNPTSSTDEISQFLRQFLVRSSTAPSATIVGGGSQSQQRCFSTPSFVSQSRPNVVSDVDFIDQGHSFTGTGFEPSIGCYSGNVMGTHFSSSSIGASENETDENDCESEQEGIEAMVDGTLLKTAPNRSSSKRSRAAEVHNLSEKRRRSRINEKMKSLQNLIPNSNKTDKASMLDDAIEYLKQLQLQVQMLSMRNGLSLHPLCFPQSMQSRENFGQENRSTHLATSSAINQETSIPIMQDQSGKFTSIPTVPDIIHAETAFGLDSTIQTNFEPFNLFNPSDKEMCRGNILANNQPNASNSKTNLSGYDETGSLEACLIRRDHFKTERPEF